MGHYDDQREAWYDAQRAVERERVKNERKKERQRIERDAHAWAVPLVEFEYEVVAMCDGCGSRVLKEKTTGAHRFFCNCGTNV